MKRLLFLWITCTNFLIGQNDLALLHTHNNIPSNTTETIFSNSFTSFELINGLPVVQAELNGQMGNFIIDTGAPGIVINSKSKKSKNMVNGGGISGDFQIHEVLINAFQWENIQLNNITGLAFDISHLEESADKEIAGLIGYEILENFELFFDFESKTIRIYTTNNSELHKNNKPKEVISFHMQSHIPIINVKIEGRNFKMGIDTGAEVNLIDKQLFKKLDKNNLLNTRVEELRGLDGKVQRQIATEIMSTQTKKSDFKNMKYLTTNFSEMNEAYGLELDGLLGAPFFKSAKVSINYKKRKIYIW